MRNRPERLDALFLQEINPVIAKFHSRLSGGIITLTGVSVSKSLETACVYYSVLGTPEEVQAAAPALNGLKREIAAQLRARLRLKRIPSISFQLDTTAEKAARVETILGCINKETKPENG